MKTVSKKSRFKINKFMKKPFNMLRKVDNNEFQN